MSSAGGIVGGASCVPMRSVEGGDSGSSDVEASKEWEETSSGSSSSSSSSFLSSLETESIRLSLRGGNLLR